MRLVTKILIAYRHLEISLRAIYPYVVRYDFEQVTVEEVFEQVADYLEEVHSIERERCNGEGPEGT